MEQAKADGRWEAAYAGQRLSAQKGLSWNPIHRLPPPTETLSYANPVLQQVQPSLQRY
jgi:hypothetical protein